MQNSRWCNRNIRANANKIENPLVGSIVAKRKTISALDFENECVLWSIQMTSFWNTVSSQIIRFFDNGRETMQLAFYNSRYTSYMNLRNLIASEKNCTLKPVVCKVLRRWNIEYFPPRSSIFHFRIGWGIRVNINRSNSVSRSKLDHNQILRNWNRMSQSINYYLSCSSSN